MGWRLSTKQLSPPGAMPHIFDGKHPLGAGGEILFFECKELRQMVDLFITVSNEVIPVEYA